MAKLPARRDPTPEYGPAMRALHPRWRKAVEMLFLAGGNQTQALRLSGYTGEPNSLKVTASRLFADDRVRKALREECDRRTSTLEPEMMAVTLEVVRDLSTKPADRLRAASMIWDRANPIQSKHLISVEHSISEPERELQHYRALQKLGAPREAFLQRFGPNGLPRVEAMVAAEEAKRLQIESGTTTIDGEYEEIEIADESPTTIVSPGTVDEELE
jgi:hypothetical protein